MIKIGQILLLLFLLTFVVISFTATQTDNHTIWPDKEQLLQNLRKERRIAFVYPDRGKYAAAYRAYVEARSRQGRYQRILPVPMTSADTLRDTMPVCYLGTPASNPKLAEILPDLPIHFDQTGFSLGSQRYTAAEDVAIFALPHPRQPQRYLQIITGNDDGNILKSLQQRPGWWAMPGDYTITRGENLIAYGFFEQKAPGAQWEIDPSREKNFLRDRHRVWQDSFFVVDYIGQKIPQNEIENFVAKQTALLLRQCRKLEIPPGARRIFLPIHLALYEMAESKTIATHNSTFSSWQPEQKEIHLVFSERIRGEDFTAVAEYIAWHWAGGIPNENLLRGVGVLFSNGWGSDGYSTWAGRLFHAGYFFPFSEIFSTESSVSISPYIARPQLASFLQFILETQNPDNLRELLQNTPAEISQTEFNKIFSEPVIERWRRWCRETLPQAPPDSITGASGFAKGFCYAHEGYAVYNGYMGHTSQAALQRLADLHVNAISITPFGYTTDPTKPMPFRTSNGPGSENDESLVVAAIFAREHGMRIMLKPHILLAGGRWGWPGEVKMADANDWPAFFQNYARWIIHYAIIAQMCRFEEFCAGVELVNTTIGHEKAWRDIFTKIRKIYGGRLTYAANWGNEFENIGFWDALDAIGINCYYPLSDNPAADDAELLKGAQTVARKIGAIAAPHKKPVIITEIGFPSRPASWMEPNRDGDGDGEASDEIVQRRCYEAIFQAFFQQPWLVGIYWWKWPTYLEDGGSRDTGFTPNRKAAEEVVGRWYRQQK